MKNHHFCENVIIFFIGMVRCGAISQFMMLNLKNMLQI